MKLSRRPLYANERLAWAMDKIYPFNIQAKVEVEGSISLELLKSTLARLQACHPYLQAGITSENNDPYIVYGTAKEIPLTVLEVLDKKQREVLASQELHTAISLFPGPLMRVALIQYKDSKNSEIIFTIHHAICDGICGMHVINELLMMANTLLSGNELQEKKYDEFTPFEERLSIDKALKGAPKSNHAKEEKTDAIQTPDNRNKIDMDCARSTYQINKVISQSDTKKIITACKNANIKMDALIGAVMTLALQKKINHDDEMQKQVLILCKTLINMRPFVEIETPKTQLGYYVSCISTLQRVSAEADLIDFAKKLQTVNDDNFALEIPLKNILNVNCLMMPFFSREHMLSQGAYRLNTVTVSNLGILDFYDNDTEIKLKNMSCAMTSHVFPMNENVFTVILFTLHGKLNLNFQFVKPYITTKAATLMVKYTLDQLKKITG